MKIVIFNATTEMAYRAEKADLPVKAFNFRRAYTEEQLQNSQTTYNPIVFDIEIKRVIDIHIGENEIGFCSADTGEYIVIEYTPYGNEIAIDL